MLHEADFFKEAFEEDREHLRIMSLYDNIFNTKACLTPLTPGCAGSLCKCYHKSVLFYWYLCAELVSCSNAWIRYFVASRLLLVVYLMEQLGWGGTSRHLFVLKARGEQTSDQKHRLKRWKKAWLNPEKWEMEKKSYTANTYSGSDLNVLVERVSVLSGSFTEPYTHNVQESWSLRGLGHAIVWWPPWQSQNIDLWLQSCWFLSSMLFQC